MLPNKRLLPTALSYLWVWASSARGARSRASIVLAPLFWHPDTCFCCWMGRGRSASRQTDQRTLIAHWTLPIRTSFSSFCFQFALMMSLIQTFVSST